MTKEEGGGQMTEVEVEVLGPISYTGMQTWLMCPRRKELDLLGMERSMSSAQARGIAFHKALQLWGQGENTNTCCQAALDIAGALSRGELPPSVTQEHWDGTMMGDPIDFHALGRAVAGFCDKEYTHPTECEVHFQREMTFEDHTISLTFEGVLDAVYQTNYGLQIVDYKLTGKKDYLPPMEQLAYYAYFYRGGYPDLATHHFIICSTLLPSLPRVLPLEWELGETNLSVSYRLIPVARAIKAGAFPARNDGWWCSPKWCEFWEKCEGGRK